MKTKRLWEIDSLRGIAIVMMILYHVLWALNFSGLINFPQINTGLWRIFAYATAFIFIFLVGVSLTLSYSNIKKTHENYLIKYLKRGLFVYSCGLIVTFASYFLYQPNLVYFGILHFIGIGIILAMPFLNLKKMNLIIGSTIIAAGILLYRTATHIPGFILFGTSSTPTLDYFPVLPWFGVILLGIFFGNLLYPDGKRTFKIQDIPFKESLAFLGRYSLIIYFIHAVLIFGAIFIIKQFWL